MVTKTPKALCRIHSLPLILWRLKIMFSIWYFFSRLNSNLPDFKIVYQDDGGRCWLRAWSAEGITLHDQFYDILHKIFNREKNMGKINKKTLTGDPCDRPECPLGLLVYMELNFQNFSVPVTRKFSDFNQILKYFILYHLGVFSRCVRRTRRIP